MKSQLIGQISLDEQLIQKDINKMLQFEFSDVYSDYVVIGDWKVCILWNHSGSHHDSLLREYEGKPQPTALGSQLTYLKTVIENVFNVDYIKWARVFLLHQGLIVPHTDYVELDKGFFRIHIPLQTNLNCLNSSEDVVFHMRRGEVWFLDAAKPHSACNFSNTIRLSLCIDFIPSISLREIFRDPNQYNPDLTPHIVNRPPLDINYMKGLRSLGYLIEEENFDDIITLLSKVHFLRSANAGAMFDWMVDIAEISGNKDLFGKVLAMKRFYIEKRSLGEILTV
jgi:hypothetical protein